MLSQISSEKIVAQFLELETQERKLEEDIMDRLKTESKVTLILGQETRS